MEKKKKVMVVDDEEDFLWIIKLNLERTGKYEVMTLSDAKDIASKIKTFKPELIFLDMRMPAIEGTEVCDILSKEPRGKDIPIILVSSWPDDRDKVKPYKVPISCHLIKPVDPKVLISKAEEILNKHE